MTIEKAIRLIAGSLVLLGLGLGDPKCTIFVSTAFLWLPAFVGFMLAQSVFTGFCPMGIILKALGLKEAAAAPPKAG
jgi:hypothetical protein